MSKLTLTTTMQAIRAMGVSATYDPHISEILINYRPGHPQRTKDTGAYVGLSHDPNERQTDYREAIVTAHHYR